MVPTRILGGKPIWFSTIRSESEDGRRYRCCSRRKIGIWNHGISLNGNLSSSAPVCNQ